MSRADFLGAPNPPRVRILTTQSDSPTARPKKAISAAYVVGITEQRPSAKTLTRAGRSPDATAVQWNGPAQLAAPTPRIHGAIRIALPGSPLLCRDTSSGTSGLGLDTRRHSPSRLSGCVRRLPAPQRCPRLRADAGRRTPARRLRIDPPGLADKTARSTSTGHTLGSAGQLQLTWCTNGSTWEAGYANDRVGRPQTAGVAARGVPGERLPGAAGRALRRRMRQIHRRAGPAGPDHHAERPRSPAAAR